MVTIMAEKPDGSLVNLGMHTTKMDSLKLTAGFPFYDFELPNLKCEILKSKVDSEGIVKTDFKNTINGSYINGAIMDSVITDKGKKSDFYNVQNELFIGEKEYTYVIEWETSGQAGYMASYPITPYPYLVENFFADTFNIVMDNSLEFLPGNGYATFYSDVGTGMKIYIKRSETPGADFIVKREDIKSFLQSLRWIAVNVSPCIARIVNSSVVIQKKLNLVNPYTFHSGGATVLDVDQIIKWKEAPAWNGFELTRAEQDEDSDIVDKKTIEVTGKGKRYSINLSSPPEELWLDSLSRENPLSVYYSTFAQAWVTAQYYRSQTSQNRLEITTLETTPVVPYSIVEIEETLYYCIKAEIPFQDHGEYKYIFQEKA